MPDNTEKFITSVNPTWCAGCGNFSIWIALRQAFSAMGIEPDSIAMTFDIGCAGNAVNWHKVYSFHTLHGRSLPVALGIKMANPDLKVIADAGDGGGYGEGANHFLHACRTNIDVTFLVHNNKSFSLTKGQSSPTSEMGYISPSTPFGLKEKPLNPLQIAIVSGATFVARGFAGDLSHLSDILRQAVSHNGFALVDVLQPCPIYNQMNSFEWYRERVYRLKNFDFKNKSKAIAKSGEWGDKIPIGVFYKEKSRPFSGGFLKSGRENAVKSVKKRNVEKFFLEFQ